VKSHFFQKAIRESEQNAVTYCPSDIMMADILTSTKGQLSESEMYHAYCAAQ